MNANLVTLIERIGQAKMKLKQMKEQRHSKSCPVETDPEGVAPCDCGVTTRNNQIDEVLRILQIPGSQKKSS